MDGGDQAGTRGALERFGGAHVETPESSGDFGAWPWSVLVHGVHWDKINGRQNPMFRRPNEPSNS